MYEEVYAANCSFNYKTWPANCGFCCMVRTILNGLLVLGTLGNGVSFTIFMRPALRDVVTTLYYRALVLINLAMLYFGLIPLGVLMWAHDIHQGAARALCITMDASLTFLTYSEAWTMVVLCSERLFGVLYPHRAMIIWTKRRAFLSLAMVAVSCAIVTIPEVLFVSSSCITKDIPVLPASLRLVFHVILPLAFLVICLFTIIIGVYRSTKSLQSNSTTRTLQTSMAKILLSLTLTYLLFSVPSTIKVFLYSFMDSSSLDDSTSYLIEVLVNFMFFANCCIKFIIFRSICPRFSQQCNIFCGLEKPRERNMSVVSNANYSTLLEKSLSR